ncbi:MAG: hypothetical protein ACYDCO_23260 [Armatimonadota bacterium]
MASWSFYLGLFGFIAVALSPVLQAVPFAGPILLYGGLALGVIAVVLGVVGLASVNRISAVAGLLFGALAVIGFAFFQFYYIAG